MSGREANIPLRDVGERGKAWKSPISNLSIAFRYRFLVRNLVRREVRGKYRNAVLGYTWTILEPALLTSVYFFLFVMLAGNPDEMYPVWVILGVIVWGCFGKALQATVSSLSRNAQTIHLVYFPRIIFPLTAVIGNITISLMSCLIVIPIMFVYNLPFTIYVLYIPISVLIAGFLGVGVGMLVAPLNCVFRDVEHLFRFIVRAGFFLSPVMWTIDMALEKGWGELTLLNPMAVPLTLVRDGVSGNAPSIELAWIGYSLAFLLISWIIGAFVFERNQAEAVKYL